jgi:polygalacturonase
MTKTRDLADLGGGFIQAGTGAVQRTVESKLQDVVSVKDFGADPTGVADSSAAIQAAIDYAVSSNIRQVNLGYGIFKINTTINFHTKGISFVGIESSSDQTGSVFAGCSIIWTGGASPMFRATTTRIRFAGFGVENQGSATDWLEMNSGAQANTFENLYFVDTATHVPFSRSVIRSNGNRMGYSQFRNLIVTSPAPVFLDVDGQGTANAMTPIHFDDRCIVASTTASMTFIKFTDESCEGINIQNCTFIQGGYELVIFDSTSSPAADVCDWFTFENNEIDSDTTVNPDNAAWRFFKFTNTRNIAFNQNTINGGGTKTFVAALVGSNVSSCSGTRFRSIGTALFDADATSSVRPGYQYGGNQRPVFTTVSAGTVVQTYGVSIFIDGRQMDAGKHEIVTIDVTNASGYTISIDTSAPQYMTIGQVFTVVVRNTSGGVIAAPVFGATFNTSGVGVAPANGFNRSYTFYFNGTKGVEISRGAADVAN